MEFQMLWDPGCWISRGNVPKTGLFAFAGAVPGKNSGHGSILQQAPNCFQTRMLISSAKRAFPKESDKINIFMHLFTSLLRSTGSKIWELEEFQVPPLAV